MNDFITIDEMQNRLDKIAESVPKEFFDELNLGIILVEDVKFHPKSIGNTLYVLGEYQRSRAGAQIVLYYGSIKNTCSNMNNSELDEKLEELVFHEFTHHIEHRAGEYGLEIKDKEELMDYLNKRRG